MITQIDKDQLLTSDATSVIWRQGMDMPKVIAKACLYCLVYILILFFYYETFRSISFIKAISENGVTPIELISMILIAALIIIMDINYFYARLYKTYEIYPIRICIQWGLLKKYSLSIPYEKITAIKLVNYDHNKYSTIYFGTTTEFNSKRLNKFSDVTRANITFENVKNGEKVYELLHKLWTKRKNNNIIK